VFHWPLTLLDAHDQRPAAPDERVVIHVASINKCQGFTHVSQGPWKPCRDLLWRNFVTTLKNAGFDALHREFRCTNVQVIEKHLISLLLSFANQVELRRVREHRFPNEARSGLEKFHALSLVTINALSASGP